MLAAGPLELLVQDLPQLHRLSSIIAIKLENYGLVDVFVNNPAFHLVAPFSVKNLLML